MTKLVHSGLFSWLHRFEGIQRDIRADKDFLFETTAMNRAKSGDWGANKKHKTRFTIKPGDEVDWAAFAYWKTYGHIPAKRNKPSKQRFKPALEMKPFVPKARTLAQQRLDAERAKTKIYLARDCDMLGREYDYITSAVAHVTAVLIHRAMSDRQYLNLVHAQQGSVVAEAEAGFSILRKKKLAQDARDAGLAVFEFTQLDEDGDLVADVEKWGHQIVGIGPCTWFDLPPSWQKLFKE